MPSKHSATRKAVTFRLPEELLEAMKRRAAERGETLTAAMERMGREYADSPLLPVFMPPPPAPR